MFSHDVSRMRTVRYTFPVAVITTILFGLAAVSTTEHSYISLVTSNTRVVKGEEVTIEVLVNAHVPVNAVDIVVDYPENELTFKGIDTGESVITLWAEEPYARNSKVYLRGGVFQKGFMGEYQIARIRLEPKTTGIVYVSHDSASLVAGDGKGTIVKTEKVDENTTRLYVNSTEEGVLKGEASFAIITDIDGNGGVDLSDISTFMAAWFSRGKTFDFNGDGRMTFRDFSILLADSFFK